MKIYDAFDVAKITAAKSNPVVTRYQHSSVILDRKGRIIARGKNHYTGILLVTSDGGIVQKTIHSEVNALQKVNIRHLKDAIIINYAKTNVAAILAYPCINCYTILQKLGFAKVFYTTRSDINNPRWQEERFEK